MHGDYPATQGNRRAFRRCHRQNFQNVSSANREIRRNRENRPTNEAPWKLQSDSTSYSYYVCIFPKGGRTGTRDFTAGTLILLSNCEISRSRCPWKCTAITLRRISSLSSSEFPKRHPDEQVSSRYFLRYDFVTHCVTNRNFDFHFDFPIFILFDRALSLWLSLSTVWVSYWLVFVFYCATKSNKIIMY